LAFPLDINFPHSGDSMKKIILALTIFGFTSFASAQTTPESYLDAIPALPKSGCHLKNSEKRNYLTTVNELIGKMDKDIQQRKKEAKVYAEANRDKMAANVMTQAGYTGTIPPKTGKMTKEERKALADQMLREQYGTSLEEVQKLKKSSKEEKTAWAMSQGANAAAAAQADPQRYQNARQQARNSYDLQGEQKELWEKINARNAELKLKREVLDQEAAAAKTKEIDPLQHKYSSLGGLVVSKIQEARIDQASKELKDAQNRYCATYSPRYLAIANEYLSMVKTTLADYYRLEEIIAKVQMGQDKPSSANSGLMGTQAVRDYAALLTNIFKYDLQSDAQ
jgi:hypothetical protein